MYLNLRVYNFEFVCLNMHVCVLHYIYKIHTLIFPAQYFVMLIIDVNPKKVFLAAKFACVLY